MGEPITSANVGKIFQVDWPNGLNCYSFAAKCKNPTGMGVIACVPGATAGHAVSQANISGANLLQACIADGFLDVSTGVGNSLLNLKSPPECDANSYLVAVFLDTRKSFHFARQLADGGARAREWVHKPSAVQEAHNMHNNYILGTDLSNVPWSPFEFVGYLKAPMDGIAVAKGAY